MVTAGLMPDRPAVPFSDEEKRAFIELMRKSLSARTIAELEKVLEMTQTPSK